MNDPGAAFGIAVDGGSVPGGSAGRRDVVAVQAGGDLTRRNPFGIFGENPAYDCRLGFDDLEPARLAGSRRVAIGAASGIASGSDDARHAAPDLLRAVLTEELADEATEADRHGVGDAIMDGAQLDAPELEIAENIGQIGHVARQAVQRLDNQHVEGAGFRVLKQPLQAVAAEDRRAGFGPVGIGPDDGEVFAVRDGRTKRDLVLDRAVGLEIR